MLVQNVSQYSCRKANTFLSASFLPLGQHAAAFQDCPWRRYSQVNSSLEVLPINSFCCAKTLNMERYGSRFKLWKLSPVGTQQSPGRGVQNFKETLRVKIKLDNWNCSVSKTWHAQLSLMLYKFHLNVNSTVLLYPDFCPNPPFAVFKWSLCVIMKSSRTGMWVYT